jgi:hypothetical protein
MLADGKAPPDANTRLIQFPRNFCIIASSVDELKSRVLSDIHHNYGRHGWLCERAVLAPKNKCVHKLTIQIQNRLPTNSRTHKSADVVVDPSQAVLYSVEFLNFLALTGFPPYNLELKFGVLIMLLRNFDPSPEVCDGTRLCVKNLYSHLIEATILTGRAKGMYSLHGYHLSQQTCPSTSKGYSSRFASHLQCPSTGHKDNP